MRALSAAEIIRLLDLKPHPEGGHFRETFRDPGTIDSRAVSTAIYFLLARGERSHWHRVDAAEVWHYYAGAPLVLEMAADEAGPIRRMKLGPDLAMGERPQAWLRPVTGRWRKAWASGRSPAARSRRGSNLPVSRWRRRIGSRALKPFV
jgi:predicted cupin superfamily sugar epimerase